MQLTCGSRIPVVTAGARRGPAVLDAVRTQHGPRSRDYRELGKLPWTAPDGLILQLGGHGQRPWLSVADRWEPVLRARPARMNWRRRGSDGTQLERWARPVHADPSLVAKRPLGTHGREDLMLNACVACARTSRRDCPVGTGPILRRGQQRRTNACRPGRRSSRGSRAG